MDKEKQVRDLSVATVKGKIVVKANNLVEAQYTLSVNEHRVLTAAMAQIEKKEQIDPARYYPVSFKDIADDVATNSNDLKKQLLKAAAKLLDRPVTFINDDDETIHTKWIQSYKYQNKQKTGIFVLFSLEVIPFISNLTKNFTILNLSEMASLSSIYAIRFYQLFMQWELIGYREIQIDALRKMMEIENKYSSVKNLRVRVVEPAVRQINEMTKLNVSFNSVKKGTKITHFCFSFAKKAREAKTMEKKPVANSKNVSIKSIGDGEHLGKYHPFSKIEIMQGQNKYPGLSEMEVRDKLLAEQKIA